MRGGVTFGAPSMPTSSQPVSDVAELSGTLLDGRYELGSILGTGGMGAVFEATDRHLGRRVAVKLMSPGLSRDDHYIKRFLREARSASKIRHRNVVMILEHGETVRGLVYSVMEFLVGQDLKQRLSQEPEGRLAWPDAWPVLLQIASGLRAAHTQGVIHRDIKPANCFLCEEDDEVVVKLVDFGIAKVEDTTANQQLTNTAQLLGTPSYIAPELVRNGNAASPRSDVYSLGVVAYETLTGQLPFEGETPLDVIINACTEPVPSMLALVPALPPAVEELITQMLAKEPEDRLPDMNAVRTRLRELGSQTLGPRAILSMGSGPLPYDSGPHSPGTYPPTSNRAAKSSGPHPKVALTKAELVEAGLQSHHRAESQPPSPPPPEDDDDYEVEGVTGVYDPATMLDGAVIDADPVASSSSSPPEDPSTESGANTATSGPYLPMSVAQESEVLADPDKWKSAPSAELSPQSPAAPQPSRLPLFIGSSLLGIGIVLVLWLAGLWPFG